MREFTGEVTNTDARQKLEDALSPHLQLSQPVIEELIRASTLVRISKNEQICSPGQVVESMFFVLQGMMRGFRIVDGREFTHHFYTEGWFATDYRSYLDGSPSELCIEAIVNVECLVFRKKDLFTLFAAHHELESMGRFIAEFAFLVMNKRLIDMQVKSLKERYSELINSNPSLFQRVSQKQIASYLGVAEQSLSRIKASSIS